MTLDDSTPLYVEIIVYLLITGLSVLFWFVFRWWEGVWHEHLMTRARSSAAPNGSRTDPHADVAGGRPVRIDLVRGTMRASRVVLVLINAILLVRLISKVLA